MSRDSYSKLSVRRRRACLPCKLSDMIPAQTLLLPLGSAKLARSNLICIS